MNLRFIAAAVLLFLALPAAAQDAPLPELPPHAAPTHHVEVTALPGIGAPDFDARAATQRYLNQVSGAARAKSDAYFEGGYGLQLLDLVVSLAVAALLLWTQLSAHVRDWVEERTRSKWLQVMMYGAIYVLGTTLLTFPVSVYEGFFREHAYGLSQQSFLSWLGDFGINTVVGLVSAIIVLPILYAAVRAAGRAWWIWCAGIVTIFLVIQIMVYPVFIAPLTNHYEPLKEGVLKHDILSLARANGIPADNVYWFDASKQTNKISANVSGFLGTTQLSLNDNLLNHSSHDEILPCWAMRWAITPWAMSPG